MTTDLFLSKCQAMVSKVLARYDWALVQADDSLFMAEVIRRLPPTARENIDSASEELVQRATTNAYCVVLYQAYKQDGSEQQIQAMTEVQQFIYRRLFVMTGGDERQADECTQDAISQAWLHWEQIRNPGTFLNYVLRIAIHGKLDRDRRRANRGEPFEDIDDKTSAPILAKLENTVEQVAENNDLEAQLQRVLGHCLSKATEISLIVDYYLHNKSYQEIAEETGRPPKTLHMQRFKALEKLKKCGEFAALGRSLRGLE